jgi:hypothetical protein
MSLTYPELVHQVISEVAPAELELLPEVTAVWLDGEGSSGTGAKGGSIGIGLDPSLITLVVYPVVAGAVASVLGDTAIEGRRWAFRRRKPRAPVEVPPLSAEQLDAVGEAVRVRAADVGLTKKKAGLLADAVCGALARRPPAGQAAGPPAGKRPDQHP